MRDCYLAVDIGASGGRHVLGEVSNGRIRIEEVYRFDNYMDEVNNRLTWNIDRLFEEVVRGMNKCAGMKVNIKSMAIDTWGVDYVLLDKDHKPLYPVYAYRDKRTEKTPDKVDKIISPTGLYERTGIQRQPFNTLYQLIEHRDRDRDIYERAEHMLLLPDYLTYLLTGSADTEYTNATTTGLLDRAGGDWDYELIDRLGIKSSLFGNIVKPGTDAGRLKPEVAAKAGLDTRVIRTASHDTASAVAAVPSRDSDFIYLSSGTWSLMGTCLKEPLCTEEAKEHNYTNEGGAESGFRFLKNIMGMWLIQCLRHEYGDEYSYEEIVRLARASEPDEGIIDVNDLRLMAPRSIMGVIDLMCKEKGIDKPCDIGGYASLIYRSLAACYRSTVKELEELTGIKYDFIHVIGGGSKADYLNMLMAQETGKTVYAGPTEATAIGNMLIQMIRDGVFGDLTEARSIVRRSFPITVYE